MTPNRQIHSSALRPVAIDLFSGAGGLSLGFEQAGFDVIAAVEYDPVHAATHLFNFPQTEVLCRDASQLTAEEILKAAAIGFERTHPGLRFPSQIDAIVGGPPCQGFSTGGKRQEDDERNDLLLEYVRLVCEIRPATFCLENVAGLLEAKFERVREEAFSRLSEAGYQLSGTQKAINCVNFGVPQSRRRVIVLGTLGSQAPARPIPTDTTVTVYDAFDGLPNVSRYQALLTTDEVALSQEDLRRRAQVKSQYARQLSGLELTPGDRSRPRVWSPGVLTNARRTVHEDATLVRFKATDPGSVEPKSRLYRLSSTGTSRTLRAGTGSERGAHTSPRPIHPEEDRVITVREAARLHGYPDWFRFHTTNWHGHRQVGNSVPPPLAKAAATVLIKALGRNPTTTHGAVHLGDVGLLRLSRSKALPIVNALEAELPALRTRMLPAALE